MNLGYTSKDILKALPILQRAARQASWRVEPEDPAPEDFVTFMRRTGRVDDQGRRVRKC